MRLPRRLAIGTTIACAAILGAVHAELGWGALATPSRHWDGAVAWDVKAAVLTQAPTLTQPFFRDPLVYSHSRDYPLLQPLLRAQFERNGLPGRLVFPLFAVLFIAAVFAAARRRHGMATALVVTTAAAVTPMITAPTSGGFDSGYADGLVAAALAVTAAGLVRSTATWIYGGACVLVLAKPEGLAYAAILLAAVWLRGERRALVAATLGITSGGGLALALQRDLAGSGGLPPIAILTAVAGCCGVWFADARLRRCEPQRLWRWLALLAFAIAAGVLFVALVPSTGSLGAHFDGARLLERLTRLPRIVGAIGFEAGASGRFGLTFVLALAAAIALRRRRFDPALASVSLWLALFLPVLCMPFVTSPLTDLEHHLRSTLGRLLFHVGTVAWVFVAATPWPLPLETKRGGILSDPAAP
jgi:hypothetical protein